MARIITNVIFDIGRVLLEYEPEAYLKAHYNEEKATGLMELVYKSKLWLDSDRGDISFGAMLEKFSAQRPEWAGDLKYLISRDWLVNEMKPKQGVVDFMRGLGASGYKLYLLSNFPAEPFSWMEETHSFLNEVDGKIISGRVRLVKPDPAIYRLLLERFGLAPSESVFIDDSEANIQAARDAGLHGIVFTGAGALREEFARVANGQGRA